ncbi:MAG: divergent polysaccharide deacetylase family protein, partial [Alteromonadaceae bacterium]|nr:divergent polysaccharide deacetylase family protein [Alteromonadaceae bacterium]
MLTFCCSQGVSSAAPVTTAANKPAEIYIIIDDMGYRPTDVSAFSLPAAVTFSILPHTPQGSVFAEQAHAQARDVMLHLPMQA